MYLFILVGLLKILNTKIKLAFSIRKKERATVICQNLRPKLIFGEKCMKSSEFSTKF